MMRRLLQFATALLLLMSLLIEMIPARALTTQPDFASQPQQSPGTPLGYVRVSFLNIRQFPNPRATIVGKLARGEQVFVQGTIRSRRWVLVTASSGRSGWVNAYYLRLTTPAYLLPFVP